MSEPVVLVGDVWRERKTGREVEVVSVGGQLGDEWATVRTTNRPHHNCTAITTAGLFKRYVLVADGPDPGSGAIEPGGSVAE